MALGRFLIYHLWNNLLYPQRKKGCVWYVLEWLYAICSKYSNNIKGICPSPVDMKRRGERCLTFMNAREIQSIISYRLSHWIHFCWWFMAHSFLFCLFQGCLSQRETWVWELSWDRLSLTSWSSSASVASSLDRYSTYAVFRPEAKRKTNLTFWTKRGQNRNSFNMKANGFSYDYILRYWFK